MKTTLNKIRAHSPCTDGWEKLLTYLGKTKADDEPLSLLTIIDSNGIDDALWCLRAVEGYDKEIRLFAVWCARQVQHLLTNKRSLDALDTAERYANGQATEAELTAAGDTARAAVRDVVRPAGSSGAAAWYAAAKAAANATNAADTTAWDAAWYAARAAAWAVTRSAAGAYAAESAAWAKQEAELRRICGEGE